MSNSRRACSMRRYSVRGARISKALRFSSATTRTLPSSWLVEVSDVLLDEVRCPVPSAPPMPAEAPRPLDAPPESVDVLVEPVPSPAPPIPVDGANWVGAEPAATPADLPAPACPLNKPFSISASCNAEPFCTGYTKRPASSASVGRSSRRIHVSTCVSTWLRGVTTTSALRRSTGNTRASPPSGLAINALAPLEPPEPDALAAPEPRPTALGGEPAGDALAPLT